MSPEKLESSSPVRGLNIYIYIYICSILLFFYRVKLVCSNNAYIVFHTSGSVTDAQFIKYGKI